jgi:hypothetical protein
VDPAVTEIRLPATGPAAVEDRRAAVADAAGMLEPKLTLLADCALFEAIQAFTGPPDMLHAESNIKRLAGTRRNTA